MTMFAIYYGASLAGLAIVLRERARTGTSRRALLSLGFAGLGGICLLGAALVAVPAPAALPLGLGVVAIGLARAARHVPVAVPQRVKRRHDHLRLTNL